VEIAVEDAWRARAALDQLKAAAITCCEGSTNEVQLKELRMANSKKEEASIEGRSSTATSCGFDLLLPSSSLGLRRAP
jgi:hypothetical protein